MASLERRVAIDAARAAGHLLNEPDSDGGRPTLDKFCVDEQRVPVNSETQGTHGGKFGGKVPHAAALTRTAVD
jgi:hypothetical protein